MVGTVLLALASGFLSGIVLLAVGIGFVRARRLRALRLMGGVTLLALLVLALLCSAVFVWLAALSSAPTVSAFTLGAGLGAAVGVAIALIVGLTLVALLLLRAPLRSATVG